MKVLLPPQQQLHPFEKALQTQLENAEDINGYALMEFFVSAPNSARQLAIDAILFLEPATFICIEAKGYAGTWTGHSNTQWMSDSTLIESSGSTNPFKQLRNYTFLVQNRLKSANNNRNTWIDNIIVVPDSAVINIENAIVDNFKRGANALHICHLSSLVEILGNIRTPRDNRLLSSMEEIIARTVDGIPLDRIPQLITHGSKYHQIVGSESPKSEPPKPESPKSEYPKPVPLKSEPLKPVYPKPESSKPVPSKSEPLKTVPPKSNWLKFIIFAIILLPISGLGLKSFPYFTKAKLSADTVTIGTLGEPERYTELRDHLEKNLIPRNYFAYLKGEKIIININGDRTLPYQEAQNRIKNQQWDVAFTLSPVNSIYAKEQGYNYIARMYPDSPYYQAALMVHKDSSIQSIDDIKPSTIVALGAFNSASSFYMPVYALYGKTISVTTGHRGADIRDMVKNKKVDLGSAAIGEIQQDSSLRLIGTSGALPGSGVYISPKLSEKDQESLKKVILSAPESAKHEEKANYDNINEDGKPLAEPDYTEFKKIMNRVDEITICSNFTKNPVNLFCPTGFTPYSIQGKVNGTKLQAGKYLLTVAGQDSQVYLVSLSENIFNELTNGGQLNALQGKEISAKVIGQPQKTQQGLLANVTQSQQIKVIE